MSKQRFIEISRRRIMITACVVIVGVLFLIKSQAASPSTSIEAESGSTSGNNLVVTNQAASNGLTIRFNNQANAVNKGTHIIYSSASGSATSQIWKMKNDGSDLVQLTNDPLHEYQWARPSPDGKNILFTQANAGESVNLSVSSNTLWIMSSDGTDKREIISTTKRNSYNWTGLAHAEWSPDSQKIILAAPTNEFTTQLFIVDTDGNNPLQLTNRTIIDGQQTNALDPSWGPDNTVMFIRSWNCLFICSNQDVFKIDTVSKQETRITSDPGLNWDPYLSPDGSKYIWLYFRDSPILCPCDLYRGNTVGSLNPQPIIADGGANANGTFSADGQQLLFLKQVTEGGVAKQRIHRINFDGTNLTPLGISDTGETGIASYWP